MPPRAMRWVGVVALLLAAPAAAQSRDDDEPLPYDDDDSVNTRTPTKGKRVRDRLREEEAEEREREESPLIFLDDPNTGLSFEVLSGVMLFESSRGALVDPRWAIGGRFTWEYGRLIPDPVLREVFFADVAWFYAWTEDGTTQVNQGTHVHGFTVAPAFALPFGTSPFSAYLQVGTGVSYTWSVLSVDTVQTTLGGVKFLFQYGAGIRARVPLTEDKKVRLSFRAEFTRFIRGYMHDTLVGGSVGITF